MDDVGGAALDAVVVLLPLDRVAGHDALVVSLVAPEPSPEDHAVAAAHAEVVAGLPDSLVALTMDPVAGNADPGAAFVSLLVALVDLVAAYIGLALVVVLTMGCVVAENVGLEFGVLDGNDVGLQFEVGFGDLGAMVVSLPRQGHVTENVGFQPDLVVGENEDWFQFHGAKTW